MACAAVGLALQARTEKLVGAQSADALESNKKAFSFTLHPKHTMIGVYFKPSDAV